MIINRSKIVVISFVVGGIVLVLGIFVWFRPTPNYSLSSIHEVKNLVPVAVVGGGPAGLSAAMYTARARFPTMVFAGSKIGGELLEASYIENWPAKEKLSGQEMMAQSQKQAEHFGAQIIPVGVEKINLKTWPFEIELDNGDHICALSIIITTGGAQKFLDIPGIDTYRGKGIGICTICDAPFDKGYEVAVIGGGDAAADKALQLAAYAKKVTILVRSSSMRAAAVVQEYLKAIPSIEVLYDVEVVEVQGNGSHVTGLKLEDTKTKKTSTLPIRTVYFALGFSPTSQLFKGQLAIDNQGYIELECRTHKTSRAGVFAAGNVTDPFYQKAGYAAGMGIGAALDSIAFLTDLGFSSIIADQWKSRYYVPNMGSFVHPVGNSHELSSLLAKQLPTIVLFHSHHCPVCQEILRKINNRAQQLKDAALFVAVDIEKAPELVKEYKVERVPALFVVEKGSVVHNFGRTNLDQFKEFLSGFAN